MLVLTPEPDAVYDPGRAAELAKVAAYPQAPTRRLHADENDIFNGNVPFIFTTVVPTSVLQRPLMDHLQDKK